MILLASETKIFNLNIGITDLKTENEKLAETSNCEINRLKAVISDNFLAEKSFKDPKKDSDALENLRSRVGSLKSVLSLAAQKTGEDRIQFEMMARQSAEDRTQLELLRRQSLEDRIQLELLRRQSAEDQNQLELLRKKVEDTDSKDSGEN